MPFDLRERWCLGQRVVPFETLEEAEILDDDATLLLECLDFSSRAADYLWIEEALELPHREFRKKSFAIIEDIRASLRAHRGNLRPREGKRQTAFLEVQVRGRTLLVQNNVRRVFVGFRPANLKADLEWLLEQLRADLGAPPPLAVIQGDAGDAIPQDAAGGAIVVAGAVGGYLGNPAQAPPVAPPPGAAAREALESGLRATLMTAVRAHPDCAGLSWQPSRFAFELRKRAGNEGELARVSRHEVRVAQLAKTRKAYDYHPHLPTSRRNLEIAFEEAQAKLLGVLGTAAEAPVEGEAQAALGVLQDA